MLLVLALDQIVHARLRCKVKCRAEYILGSLCILPAYASSQIKEQFFYAVVDIVGACFARDALTATRLLCQVGWQQEHRLHAANIKVPSSILSNRQAHLRSGLACYQTHC